MEKMQTKRGSQDTTHFNQDLLDSETLSRKNIVLLLDDDSKFSKQLQKIGKNHELDLVRCFNFSDFWTLISKHRAEILAVIVDDAFVGEMLKMSNFHRIDKLPIVVTSNRTKPIEDQVELPFYQSIFVHKKYGASVLVDSVLNLKKSGETKGESFN